MTASPPLNHTVFYHKHLSYGAQMMEFAGWQLPSFYRARLGGAIKEHHQVRQHCGVFDVSHMAQITLTGAQASTYLDQLIPTELATLTDHYCLYTCLLNHHGGIIDDLIIYRFSHTNFMLCVNASRRHAVMDWLTTQPQANTCIIKDVSDHYSLLAIQGPKSLATLKTVLTPQAFNQVTKLDFLEFTWIQVHHQQCLLSRTGYSGELGYELYLTGDQHFCEHVFDQLLTAPNTQPVGLSARQSLRIEAGFLLYGTDMNHTTSPHHVGLSWLISQTKSQFIGQQALATQVSSPATQPYLGGFIMNDQGIPRTAMSAMLPDTQQPLGQVTSGAYLPTLNQAGGFIMLNQPVDINTTIMINMRSRPRKATMVKRPFYLSKARHKPQII